MVEAAEMWEVDWGSAAEAAEAAAGQAQATLGQAVVQIVEDEMVGAPLLLACRAGACQHIAVPGAHADVGMHTVVGNGVDVGMHTVVGTDVEGVVRAEVGLHGEVGLRVEVGLHVEVGLLERFLRRRVRNRYHTPTLDVICLGPLIGSIPPHFCRGINAVYDVQMTNAVGVVEMADHDS